MAEGCPDSRRCLPSWMLKDCSGNEVLRTEDQNKRKQPEALDQIKPVRRKGARQIKTVQKEDFGEVRALQQCQGRENARRRRMDVNSPVKDECEQIEKITSKNVKKVSRRAAPKSSRKRKLANVRSEVSLSGNSDEEIELTMDKEDFAEVRALRKCQGRENARRRSKDVNHPVEDESEQIEEITSKNVKKVSGRAAPKSSRKRNHANVRSEASSSGNSDEEIELTVEDLVRIAEEIVRADKEKQQKLQTTKTIHYEEHHHPCPPFSTAVDTRGSVISTAVLTRGVTQCTTTASTIETTPSEYRVDEKSVDKSLQRSSSVKLTGDVAQDMLNIYLGPLLSKPAGDENKSAAIESMIMNTKYVPRKEDLKSKVQMEGEPVMKKKSSLKDKIALFL